MWKCSGGWSEGGSNRRHDFVKVDELFTLSFFFFFVYNIVSSTKRGLGWAVGWVKKESISLIYDSTLVHDDEDMKVK